MLFLQDGENYVPGSPKHLSMNNITQHKILSMNINFKYLYNLDIDLGDLLAYMHNIQIL